MDLPLVTIGLTSYNHDRFLRDSIESVLNQTYPNFELIIIDDASTDESQSIINEYAMQDSRIKPIFNPSNIGRSIFYDMLDQCKGSYIAIAHSDDKWAPTKLEKQVQYLEENPGVEACFTNVQVFDDEGSNVNDGPYASAFKTYDWSRFQWLRYFFLKGNAFCHPSLLIRKRAYAEYGLVTRGLSGLPDMCSWIRLLLKREVKVLPEKLTFFRVHNDGSNVSGINPSSNRRIETEFYFVLDEFCALDKPDDLLLVFPEASKYVVHGESVPKYMLAMMALELGGKVQHRLFALRLLYEIQNDEIMAAQVEHLYGFERHRFNSLKFDNYVFPEADLKALRLYVAPVGREFREDDALVRYYQFDADGQACLSLSFDLPNMNGSNLRVRVDPIEGQCVCVKVVDAQIGGRELDLKPINALFEDGDGYDVFLSRDPRYYVNDVFEANERLDISISIKLFDPMTLEGKVKYLERSAEKREKRAFPFLNVLTAHKSKRGE